MNSIEHWNKKINSYWPKMLDVNRNEDQNNHKFE